MSPKQLDPKELDDATDDAAPAGDESAAAETDETLDLDVKIDSPSACERHVTVTISRKDIDRYYDDAYSELMPTANVPGFRTGRAPRKIVEGKYRQEITDQIKGSLLMDSLAQISDEQKFTAIGEPELDLEAVEVPREGPMTFEFRIEVRPEFDLPKWKGLKLRWPTREFTDEDIDGQLEQMLARYGQLVPHKGPASEGDYLSLNITSTVDGKEIEREEEEVVRIRPELSFIDGQLEGFDKLMEGVVGGDKRTAEIQLTQDAPNTELRGQTVQLEFEVLEVKRLKLPELDEDFLQELGGFGSEQELRDAIRNDLERQLQYQQQQLARKQITSLLTQSADWELPPALLERQSARELERAAMELRRSGFSESEIRARENRLRQNSAASTATALKEHFILERIAEEEKLDVKEDDYNREIALMAMQSGESPRRIRAQLEKRGLMDVLRNQIIERKVLELVQQEASFKNEKYELDRPQTSAISMAAGGRGSASIPAAQAASPESAETAEAEESAD